MRVFIFAQALVAVLPMSGPAAVLPAAAREPVEGAIATHPVPAFRWEAAESPDLAALPSTVLQLAADAAFRTVVDADEIPAVIGWYVPDRPLPPGAYWWRIASRSPGGATGAWSAAAGFTIRDPDRSFRVAHGASFGEIRRILQEAATSTPARVVFDPGDYRLDPGGPVPFLDLHGARDLAIDGRGATVTLTRAAALVRIEQCERILVRGFVFDYDPPVCSACRVTATDATAGTVDAELLPGYAGPDSNPAFDRDRKGLLVSPGEEFAVKRDVPLVLAHDGVRRMDGGRYRFRFANRKAVLHFAPGDVYVLDPRWHNAGGGVTVQVTGGRDVVLYDVAIRGAANECLQASYADRAAFLHVRLERPPGRALSVNNGGNNHHNCRTGPWIEGCLFENTGDDICHVNGYVMGVESRPAADRFRIPLQQPHDRHGPAMALDLRAGDRLLFFDARAGRILAERRIVSARVDGPCVEVAVDSPPGDFRIGRLVPAPGTTAVVGNREAVQVYDASRMCNRFVFRRNVCRAGRRLGCLAKGVGGWIADNCFTDLGGGGIEFWNASFEGLGAENYVVRGNRIADCLRLPREDAGIWARAFPAGGTPIHRGLLIEGNEITGPGFPAIDISDAVGVIVRDNRVQAPGGAAPGAIRVRPADTAP